MRFSTRLFFASAVLALSLASVAGTAERSIYHIRVPEVVDPLHHFPVVVVFHDAGGSGEDLIDDDRIIVGFIEKGYAVLAPDALVRKNRRQYFDISSKTSYTHRRFTFSKKRFVMRNADGSVRPLRWSDDTGWYYYSTDRYFPSELTGRSELPGRDEIEFLRSALQNAAKSYPVESDPVLIIGLGHGGSLVWQIACHAPRLARLLAPVDAAYWHDLPPSCDAGAELIHTHHRGSEFWPLAGAGGSRQRYARTAIADNLEMLLRANRCAPPQESFRDAARGVEVSRWTNCAAGGPVELILTDRPFAFEPWWLARIHERLDAFDLPQPFDIPETPLDTAPTPRFAKPGAEKGSRFLRPGTAPGTAAEEEPETAPEAEPEAEASPRFKRPGAGTASTFKRVD